MTQAEYNKKIASIRELSTQATEQIVFLAANRMLGTIKNRIQRRGEDSNNQKLSPYSEKEAYFTRDQFVKKSAFKPNGKEDTGSEFKNGNTRKSMYMKNGYKEFREVQGRPTDKKDLTLSGDTMLSYTIGRTEGAIITGFDKKKASDIRHGQEDRNGGAIFSPTESELAAYTEEVVKGQNEFIKEIFQ